MNVYKTVLYSSLEIPLSSVIICNSNMNKELYNGPFESIPESLFNTNVNAYFYNQNEKSLKIWANT